MSVVRIYGVAVHNDSISDGSDCQQHRSVLITCEARSGHTNVIERVLLRVCKGSVAAYQALFILENSNGQLSARERTLVSKAN